MSDVDEIKKLFDDTQKVAQAAKDKADEIAKKSGDYVDQETLKKMKGELAEKIEAQDKLQADLKARLDEVEIKANRPEAPGAKPLSPEAKAFDAYVRKGVEPSNEQKAMSTQVGGDGGYLAPPTLADGVQKRLRRTSPIRQVARVIALDGNGSYDILVERGDAGFSWAGETQTRSETDTPTINRISIPLHELSAMPKASQRLLDTASFDVESWLATHVADKFARAEATAFVSGTGLNRPKGFLAYSVATTADDTRAAETLQYRATGVDGDFAASPNAADALVRLFYELQAQYMVNASWMMKNTTMADVAVLKDGDGAFLLREMLNGDGTLVRTIQGRPAYVAEDMPARASNALAIAVGDFEAGYTIVEGTGLTVLRDPFSAKPHVMFYTTKRVGGGVNDFDAIKLLKFGTT
jgi:HK97 family phage major capsid protein